MPSLSLDDVHTQSIQKISTLTTSLKHAETDNKKLIATVDALTEDVRRLNEYYEKEMSHVTDLLREEEAKSFELAKTIRSSDPETSSSRATASKTIKDLKRVEKDLLNELTEIKSNFADFKDIQSKEFAALEEENYALFEELGRYETAHAEIKATHEDYERLLKEYQSRADEDVKDVRDELEQKTEQLTKLNKVVKTCKTEYQSQLAKMNEKIGHIEATKKKFQSDLERKDGHIAKLNEEIIRIGAAKKAFHSHIEKQNGHIARLNKIIKQVEGQKKDHEENSELKSSHIARLHKFIDEQNVRLEDALQKKDEKSENIESLKIELRELQKSKDTLNDEYDLQKVRLEDALQAENENNEIIAILETALDEKDGDTEFLEQQNATLISNVDDLTIKCKLIEEKASDGISAYAFLLTEIKAQLEEAQKKVREFEQREAEWKAEVDTSKKREAEWKAEVDTFKRREAQWKKSFAGQVGESYKQFTGLW